MSEKEKILGTEDAWESGQLGESLDNARVVSSETAAQIDESLGLQMISIRLEKSLIDSFKVLGNFHGLGYQPLMRDALKRFAESEMKAIVSGLVESQRKEVVKTSPAVKPSSRAKKADMKKAA